MVAGDLRPSSEPSGRSSIRILHFIPGSPSDEIQMIFAKRQVASLEVAGVDVSYTYFEDRQSLAGLWRGYRVLTDAILEESPDIVHAHYGTMTALIAALTKRTPLVITFRGSDLNPDPTGSRFISFIKKVISQISSIRADRVIVVSEELLRRLWWKREVATVIPDGVDFDVFRPKDVLASRRRLGWSADERIVLFNAGKNPVNKRLDLAEEAVQLVQRSVPRTRLVVLAGGISPADVPTLMCASDCLLMLSDYEGSPNVVKEAMACNLPVISFEVGDVKGLIEGVDGCTLITRDIQVLADALRRTIQARERTNGRDRIRELSTISVARQIVDMYESMIHGEQ